MKDTMEQAVALSGGYGNTYAQAVGQQQYNSQMDNLSEKAIEYEQQAFNRYVSDREQQLNTINTLQNLDNTEYSRNRDAINDYNTFLNYLQNKYTTLKAVDDDTFSREFNVWQQQLGAQGTLMSTAQSNYQYENTNDINNYQFGVNTDLQKQQLAETKRKNTADIKLGQDSLTETTRNNKENNDVTKYSLYQKRRNKKGLKKALNEYEWHVFNSSMVDSQTRGFRVNDNGILIPNQNDAHSYKLVLYDDFEDGPQIQEVYKLENYDYNIHEKEINIANILAELERWIAMKSLEENYCYIILNCLKRYSKDLMY